MKLATTFKARVNLDGFQDSLCCLIHFYQLHVDNQLSLHGRSITFLDTVLGTIDFFCSGGGGLDAVSCLFRTTISVSSFSPFLVSPWRVFCGLLVGGWE